MDVDLADAAKRLEELVDRALAGELVNIIDGNWIVHLQPHTSSPDSVILVAHDSSVPSTDSDGSPL